MKTGFKNPIEPKEGKKIKSPWNYDAPQYDERSSCYVNAGTHRGVGHKQPVGKDKARAGGVIPTGRVKTMDLYPEGYHAVQDDE